jgi:hypothetical protein
MSCDPDASEEQFYGLALTGKFLVNYSTYTTLCIYNDLLFTGIFVSEAVVFKSIDEAHDSAGFVAQPHAALVLDMPDM